MGYKDETSEMLYIIYIIIWHNNRHRETWLLPAKWGVYSWPTCATLGSRSYCSIAAQVTRAGKSKTANLYGFSTGHFKDMELLTNVQKYVLYEQLTPKQRL